MRTANQIRTEARAILSEFAATYPILGHIPIRVSTRMTRSGGSARFKSGKPFEIAVSLPFFADVENNLRSTVTHEAAHIVAGHAAGHNSIWKMVHRSMGGNGKRCHTMTLAHAYDNSVEATCSKCSGTMKLGPRQATKARRGVRYAHGKCPR